MLRGLFLSRSNHDMICALTVVLEHRFGLKERELSFLANNLAVESGGCYERMNELVKEGFIEKETARLNELIAREGHR